MARPGAGGIPIRSRSSAARRSGTGDWATAGDGDNSANAAKAAATISILRARKRIFGLLVPFVEAAVVPRQV